MKHMLREMRRSMTYDRGSEMACHSKPARVTFSTSQLKLGTAQLLD
jgi:IS30 family transposase